MEIEGDPSVQVLHSRGKILYPLFQVSIDPIRSDFIRTPDHDRAISGEQVGSGPAHPTRDRHTLVGPIPNYYQLS
ncbi:unnamed protein product [Lupinus luteus]|uniref:Uncharacterized protein n=1 Tax=Lupinus luteus TaxID=3873 RepID=A0AAV1WRY4_LUPLU